MPLGPSTKKGHEVPRSFTKALVRLTRLQKEQWYILEMDIKKRRLQTILRKILQFHTESSLIPLFPQFVLFIFQAPMLPNQPVHYTTFRGHGGCPSLRCMRSSSTKVPIWPPEAKIASRRTRDFWKSKKPMDEPYIGLGTQRIHVYLPTIYHINQLTCRYTRYTIHGCALGDVDGGRILLLKLVGVTVAAKASLEFTHRIPRPATSGRSIVALGHCIDRKSVV